jgi:hypothetical protein
LVTSLPANSDRKVTGEKTVVTGEVLVKKTA